MRIEGSRNVDQRQRCPSTALGGGHIAWSLVGLGRIERKEHDAGNAVAARSVTYFINDLSTGTRAKANVNPRIDLIGEPVR